MFVQPKLNDFFAKKCVKVLMQQGLRKSEAYQWICRDFSQALDAQEIGAGRVKNRSI